MKMKRLAFIIVGVVLIVAGSYCVWQVLQCQAKISAWNKVLALNRVGIEVIQIDNAIAKLNTRSLVFAAASIVCFVSGIFLCLYPKIRGWALLLAVLSVSLLFVPVAFADASSSRWYAMLSLSPNSGANGIEAVINQEYNSLSPTDQIAFVSPHIAITRTDSWGDLEWLETGAFQNQSGTWIYAASYIQSYDEVDWRPWANNAICANFSIVQTTQNCFWAYFEGWGGSGVSPNFLDGGSGGGAYEHYEANFTLGGDNFYLTQAESNDHNNTMSEAFTNVVFYATSGWQCWSANNTQTSCDSPYGLTFLTGKLYTYGGGDPQRDSYGFGGGGGKWYLV
jgi:hypothetical protein